MEKKFHRLEKKFHQMEFKFHRLEFFRNLTFLLLCLLPAEQKLQFRSQNFMSTEDSTLSSTPSGRAWKKSIPVRFSTSSMVQ